MLGENKAFLLNRVYEYGASVDWNKYRIVELAESCYTSVYQIVEWAKIYIEEQEKNDFDRLLLETDKIDNKDEEE